MLGDDVSVSILGGGGSGAASVQDDTVTLAASSNGCHPEHTMNDLLRRIGVEHPIIQAPMAGGATTPALVSAVSDAGALGFIGAAYLTPERILEEARSVRVRTKQPFG